MNITPNYHFTGDCRQALQFYESAFNGKILMLISYKEANPEDMEIDNISDSHQDLVYHAEMMIGNQRFMFSDTTDSFQKGQSISIVITFDTSKEVKNAYEVLKEGCTIVHPMQETTYSGCFVSLIDKFGMRWELMTENN